LTLELDLEQTFKGNNYFELISPQHQ